MFFNEIQRHEELDKNLRKYDKNMACATKSPPYAGRISVGRFH